jgi:hypothetical protein
VYRKLNRRCLLMIAFILYAGLSLAAVTLHAEINPQEILKKADTARGNEDGIEWEIDIISVERGRQQQRLLKVKARNYNSLAEFLSPANVKGEKLLMIDRTMWFVKPGLSKAVPISPRQKLLGGASNGDIASTNYAGDYKIVAVSEEIYAGEACYVFDLAAINKRVTYDRIKYWISKERLVGVKSDFYTVSGKLFKTATFEYKNNESLNDRPRLFISKMVITNATVNEDVTTMNYQNVLFRKIPDSTFNLNLLLR